MPLRTPSGSNIPPAGDAQGNAYVASAPRGAVAFAIANGASESATLNMQGRTLAALQLSAAFVGTTITFKASLDGVNFFPLKNTDGSLYTLTVAASTVLPVDLTVMAGMPFLRLVAGSAQAAAISIPATTLA